MTIAFGLASESYKYVFGVYHKYAVPFEEDRVVSLIRARGDRAAVQLLIYAEEELLVCVGGEAAFDERGPIDVLRVDVEIPGLSQGQGGISASLVGLVEDDDRQMKSDILLRQSAIRVERRKVQPVWIEVEIGAASAPGVYHPQITVYRHRIFEDETVVQTLSFELKVLDVTLAQPSEYSFYLDLWQHNSNIARKYDVPLWSDGHFAILEGYVISLAALGQKAISVIVSEIPWSGQASCYDRIDPANLFEYSIVKVIRRADGEWMYDMGALNRYVELCMRHGIQEEIEVFGLLNIWVLEDAGYGGGIIDYEDAIRVRYYDEDSRTYRYVREKRHLETYIAALERNFIEMGWIDKVRILADEPANLLVFRKRLRALQAMAPTFRYKVAINHAEFMAEEGVEDHVPILDCAASEHGRIHELKAGKTGRTLFYVACDVKTPNTFIGSHLLETRAIPWLAWHLKLEGFLRWNYTAWPNDPLAKIVYHCPVFPAGDTNFVYPGRDGKPMLSLRYKLLQKGIRDYEIFARYVREGGSRERVDGLLRRVFLWRDPNELHRDARKLPQELFSLSDEDYDGITAELLKEIEATLKTSDPADLKG